MAISSTIADRLAGIFAGMKEAGVTDRDLHHQILRETLRANPKFLGVWAVWEPNALDGRDADYTHTPGHDATGRFLPVWHRRTGAIAVEPNVNCDDPGLGAYYLMPTRARRSVVVGPYEYPMGGTWTLIATLAAPIMGENGCLGACGVDFSLEALSEQVLDDPSPRTMAVVAAVEHDLHRGLVFLDRHGNVATLSPQTRTRLGHFLASDLPPGTPLPGPVAPLLSQKDRAASRDGRPRRPELTLSRYGRKLHIRLIRAQRQGFPFLLLDEESTATGTDQLSRREREVMHWVAEGKSNDEIGIILGISAHTVKNHLDKTFRKLGVDNRHAASALWHREARPKAGP